MNLPAEFRLAAACCRWPPSHSRDAAVRAAAEAVDWHRFLGMARRHRIEGLAADALPRAGVPVPKAVGDNLAASARAIAHQNLAYAAEAKRLSDLLSHAGAPHLFVKGVTLNQLAYGTLALKRSCDIDLLVDDASYAEACAVLNSAGYRCTHPAEANSPADILRYARTAKDSSWHHDAKGIVVELHQRLVPNPMLLPEIDVRSASQSVELAPGLALPTLARDELFAYLCAHGALTAWSRLKWVADLGAFLKADSPESIERLYRRAQELAPGRAPAQALLLLQDMLGLSLPPELATELKRDPINRWLSRIAIRTMIQGGAHRDLDAQIFGTVRLHLSILFLQSGRRYKAAELRRKFGGGRPEPLTGVRLITSTARWLSRRWRDAWRARRRA